MPRIYRHLFHVNKRTFWGDRRCGRGGAEFKQVKLGGVSFFKNEKNSWLGHLHLSPGAMTVVTMVWLHVNRCGNRCVVSQEMLTEAAGEEGAPWGLGALAASFSKLASASLFSLRPLCNGLPPLCPQAAATDRRRLCCGEN